MFFFFFFSNLAWISLIYSDFFLFFFLFFFFLGGGLISLFASTADIVNIPSFLLFDQAVRYFFSFFLVSLSHILHRNTLDDGFTCI